MATPRITSCEIIAKLKGLKDHAGLQFAQMERCLDLASFGPLWLRQTEVAESVESCILRGAAELQHYALLAYVVMPNHVHLLIEPRVPLRLITRGIKGTSAHGANQLLGRGGQPFWQAESFDHWVRTPAEGQKICRYIENNPVKAGLVAKPECWNWSSAGSNGDSR